MLWQMGWGIFNFNDVPEAYQSLMVVSGRGQGNCEHRAPKLTSRPFSLRRISRTQRIS